MSPELNDPWKLSSGLRDDMVISIHAAYFAPDAEYQGGRQLLLNLIGLDETQEQVTLKMSVGADWETSDGGTTITHPTKKQQYINGSTIYGHWISSAMEIPELVNVIRGRELGPLNANTWVGLIIHCQEKEIKFGKNIDPQQRLMPTEYFGLVEDAAAAPVAAPPVVPVAQAPAPAPVAAPTAIDPAALLAQARAAAANNTVTVSPLHAEMIALAKSSPDFPTFLATVLGDTRVLADDDLAQQCIDESNLFTSARS
jgi:hypothetical protein